MRVLNRALTVFASVLPLMLFCFCGGENAFFTAAAVALHECAHLAALRLFKGRILSFRAAPFGLCIDYDAESLSLPAELFVCASGCLANLLAAVVSFVCYAALRVDFIAFGLVSAALALMNLLPIYPLDGYRVVKILLSLFLSPFAAARIAFLISCIFGFIFFSVSSYLLLTSVSGIYPLLFSVYMFSVNSKIIGESTEF